MSAPTLKKARTFALVWAALLIGAILAPARAAPRQTAASLPEIHGNVRMRFSDDRMEGYESQQAAFFLGMNGRNVFWDKLGFNLDLRDRWNKDRTGTDIQKKNSLTAYEANATINDLFGVLSLKAGRQYYYAGDTSVNFDGGAAALKAASWLSLSAFGGRPVATLGQSIADEVRGAGVKFGSGRRAYLQLDAMQASYHSTFSPDREVQGTAFLRLAANVDITGNLAYLDNLPKSASLRMLCYVPNWGLTLTPNYYKHFYVGDPASTDLSPYRQTIVTPDRFERMGLGFSQYFKIGLNVSGGGNLTLPGNRQDYYASISAPNLFHTGLEAVTSANYGRDLTRYNHSYTVSAGYSITKSWKVTVGNSYSQTRDTYYGGMSNSDSLVYFGSIRWSLRKKLDITFSPSFMPSRSNNPSSTRLELTNNWRF